MRWWLVVLVVLVGLGVFSALQTGTNDAPPASDIDRAQHQPPPEAARLEGRPAPSAPEATPDPASASPNARTLFVKVEADGRGVPGAKVVALDAVSRRHEAITDAEGRATFEALAPGPAGVQALATGYVASGVREVQMPEGGGVWTSLALESGVPVTGYVRAAASGTPVAGAEVLATAGGQLGGTIAFAWRDTPYGKAATDGDGAFHFEALPLGEVLTLVVTAPGYRRARKAFRREPTEGEHPATEIRLEPGGRLHALVVDGAGRAMPGADVHVYPEGESPALDEAASMGFRVMGYAGTLQNPNAFVGRTADDGRVTIEGLGLGEAYAATATASGFAQAEEVEGLAPTEAAPAISVTLALRRTGFLEILVLGPDQEPVAGATVQVGIPPVSILGSGHTARDGRVGIGHLEPGTHRLNVDAEGFRPYRAKAVLGEGETKRTTVRLERGATITGIFVDDRGEPIAGGEVLAKSTRYFGDPSITAKTDDHGRFRLVGLREGGYGIRGMTHGYYGDSLEDVTAPADDVRLVGTRYGKVSFRLALPAGQEAPEQICIGTFTDEGASATSHGWTSEPIDLPVERGRRSIRVETPDTAPFEQEIDVAPGETVDLGTLSLTPGIELSGTVVDEHDAPVPGARFFVFDHQYGRAQTGADGRFRLPHLKPGALQIHVEAEGFAGRLLEMEARASDASLRIVLEREQ